LNWLRAALIASRPEYGLLVASGPAASPAAGPRLRFIDAYRTTFNLSSVEFLDRYVSGFISRHLDKTEAARAVGRAIHYYLRAIDRPCFGKYVLQILIRDSPGQVSNVQSAAH
jgi:hypothetical protein